MATEKEVSVLNKRTSAMCVYLLRCRNVLSLGFLLGHLSLSPSCESAVDTIVFLLLLELEHGEWRRDCDRRRGERGMGMLSATVKEDEGQERLTSE